MGRGEGYHVGGQGEGLHSPPSHIALCGDDSARYGDVVSENGKAGRETGVVRGQDNVQAVRIDSDA